MGCLYYILILQEMLHLAYWTIFVDLIAEVLTVVGYGQSLILFSLRWDAWPREADGGVMRAIAQNFFESNCSSIL